MKTLSAPLFCLGLVALIHCSSTYLAAQSSCGPMDVKFKVQTDSSGRRALAQQPQGQAQLFFIQETDGKILGEKSALITRIGIDGR